MRVWTDASRSVEVGKVPGNDYHFFSDMQRCASRRIWSLGNMSRASVIVQELMLHGIQWALDLAMHKRVANAARRHLCCALVVANQVLLLEKASTTMCCKI